MTMANEEIPEPAKAEIDEDEIEETVEAEEESVSKKAPKKEVKKEKAKPKAADKEEKPAKEIAVKEKAPVKGEEATPEKPAAEKKETKANKEEEEEEVKVLEEKIITINLRHAYLAYSRKPAPRSVNLVKKIAGKIYKTKELKIDNSVNEYLWRRGKTKSERRIRVKVQKLEDDVARVLLAAE
jgi:large subunit ribosomal protein L31e